MAKTSDFAIMADSIREIRIELAALRAHVDAPSQRVRLRTQALADKEHPDPTPVERSHRFKAS